MSPHLLSQNRFFISLLSFWDEQSESRLGARRPPNPLAGGRTPAPQTPSAKVLCMVGESRFASVSGEEVDAEGYAPCQLLENQNPIFFETSAVRAFQKI